MSEAKAKAYRVAYYKKNADKIKASSAEYYQKNAEKIKMRSREYQKNNREKVRERQRAWSEENKQAVKEKAAEYYKKNKDKYKARQAERYKKNTDAIKAAQKNWRRKNTEKLKFDATHRRYGVDADRYKEILDRQGGGCAITGRTYNLGVDHCHETGKIRGIICRKINLALGLIGDNPDIADAISLYLRRGRDEDQD